MYSYLVSPVLLPGQKVEKRSECALEEVDLIVGGTKSKPKEFPHMALIGYESPDGPVYKCGGTLISENFVLTAGHCLYDREL